MFKLCLESAMATLEQCKIAQRLQGRHQFDLHYTLLGV